MKTQRRKVWVIGWQDAEGLAEQTLLDKLQQFDQIFLPRAKMARLPKSMHHLCRFFRSPFMAGLISDIDACRDDLRVAVMASQDPMWYGVGSALARSARYDLKIEPVPSAASLAAASLAWPLEEVKCVSLHGRALDQIHKALDSRRIFAIPGNGDTPAKLAELLYDADPKSAKQSRLWVLEHLGNSKREKIIVRPLAKWRGAKRVADFHMIALEWNKVTDKEADNLAKLGSAAGLDESMFRGDKVTKWHQRARVLAWLRPRPAAVMWDVGAGSGSVSIEWVRLGGRAIAFEKDKAAIKDIEHNRKKLTANALKILSGDFGANLSGKLSAKLAADLADPDAIYIGGSVNLKTIALCVKRLRPSGRITAGAVTVAGQAALLAAKEKYGGEIQRITVENIENMNPSSQQQVWRSRLPQVQWYYEK